VANPITLAILTKSARSEPRNCASLPNESGIMIFVIPRPDANSCLLDLIVLVVAALIVVSCVTWTTNDDTVIRRIQIGLVVLVGVLLLCRWVHGRRNR
jgi:hypothetical protein